MLYTGPIKSVAFTNWQRSNLETLTAYVERLPANYRHFEMALYFDGNEAAYLPGASVDKCGTGACFLGHAVAAGIDVDRDDDGSLRWDKLRKDLSPDKQSDFWLFAAAWSFIDNTASGAAQRGRFLLRHNGVPDEFDWLSDETYRDMRAIYNQPEYSAVRA